MSTWIITPDKYLHFEQIQALRKTIEAAMLRAKSKGRQIAVRDYAVIEVALGTGLRVSELSNLLIDDIQLGRGQNSLVSKRTFRPLNDASTRLRLTRFVGTTAWHAGSA